MRTHTGRYALTGAMVTIGLILGLTGSAAATTTPRAAVTFGTAAVRSALTPAVTPTCPATGSTCAGSDPRVVLAWSGAVDTTGCRFRTLITWDDGSPAQVVQFRGAAAGKVWPVRHTYPGGVAARHPYRIRATSTVVRDQQARGCTMQSAAVTFTLTCTPEQESGPAWSLAFPGGIRSLDVLRPAFRDRVTSFVGAMGAAGATVTPQSTLRSPQRSYLMHFSYLVGKGQLAPQDVPAYVPLATETAPQVCWAHRTATGRPDRAGSVGAARSLLGALGVDASLRTPPALHSRHNTGDAIDMRITWSAKTLKIKNAAGTTVRITSTPRDGTNPDLIAVGATYGVRHYVVVNADRNHWSTDGH